MMRIEPVLPEKDAMNAEDAREIKRVGLIKLILMVVALLLACACFLNADGAYAYNISLDDKNKSLAVGQTFIVKGYVSYSGEPVREYPCIISFYDIIDNSTMYSDRIYTDELGQFIYARPVDDAFRYGGNYTYTIQCSNSVETGTLFIHTGVIPSWFMNYLVFSNSRMDWIVLGGAVLLTAFFIFWAWGHAIIGDNE